MDKCVYSFQLLLLLITVLVLTSTDDANANAQYVTDPSLATIITAPQPPSPSIKKRHPINDWARVAQGIHIFHFASFGFESQGEMLLDVEILLEHIPMLLIGSVLV